MWTLSSVPWPFWLCWVSLFDAIGDNMGAWAGVPSCLGSEVSSCLYRMAGGLHPARLLAACQGPADLHLWSIRLVCWLRSNQCHTLQRELLLRLRS